MWDRYVIAGIALLISIRAAWWGWKLGRGGDWLAGAGGFVLALIPMGVIALLITLGPASGR